MAREFIRSLLVWADVAVAGHADAVQALDWPMPDFEDALQAAAAVACGAQVILTRNVRDFKRSPVLAMTPEDFIKHNMPAKPPTPPTRRKPPRA